MTQVLKIDASGRSDGSVSRELSDRIAKRLAQGGRIAARDLNNHLPFIDEEWIGANFTPADDRTDEQKQKLALSDSLIAELRAADTLVIGTPVYNFGIPATLKTWVDHIARAGVTFRYTENGPEGLLEGKKAVVAYASGGVPLGAPVDHVTPYLKTVLEFVGITDVEFLDNEAVNARFGTDYAAANVSENPVDSAA
jgi:FMN-dependent NADH-azoreductase